MTCKIDNFYNILGFVADDVLYSDIKMLCPFIDSHMALESIAVNAYSGIPQFFSNKVRSSSSLN
jgi:hypothetical protein